jgi:hypothetical protein
METHSLSPMLAGASALAMVQADDFVVEAGA